MKPQDKETQPKEVQDCLNLLDSLIVTGLRRNREIVRQQKMEDLAKDIFDLIVESGLAPGGKRE